MLYEAMTLELLSPGRPLYPACILFISRLTPRPWPGPVPMSRHLWGLAMMGSGHEDAPRGGIENLDGHIVKTDYNSDLMNNSEY